MYLSTISIIFIHRVGTPDMAANMENDRVYVLFNG